MTHEWVILIQFGYLIRSGDDDRPPCFDNSDSPGKSNRSNSLTGKL